MVLCDRCSSIDFGLLIERACFETDNSATGYRLSTFDIVEGIPFADVRQAACQGCELCNMIQHGLLDVPNSIPLDGDLPLVDDTPIKLSLVLRECHLDLGPNHAQCYGLFACRPTGMSLPETGVVLTIASSNAHSPYVPKHRSPWNPSLWRSWVDQCVKTHTPCNPVDSNRYTPSRLIDVGSDLSTLRLVEACEGTPEYVALSHCWGGSLPLRTTSANLHDHLDTIPWELMPATFQDAVRVTRAMGYQFLWIDCLCIVQDSESDWLHECALMSQVYTCAAVTIAASQSASPSDGMFRPMDRWSHTCAIPARWPGDELPDLLTIGLPPQPDPLASKLLLRSLFWTPDLITRGPLSSRGWAFQERILSRRVLHLCASGTYFECTYCEFTDHLPWPSNMAPMNYSTDFFRPFLRTENARPILDQWHNMVGHYSRRFLTNGGDRLPAISGLARLVAARLNQSYVAGMWSDDLLVGLLWSVEDPRLPLAMNVSRYIGPSWSWTSVNRNILYPAAFDIRRRHPRTRFESRNSIYQLEVYDWVPCLEIQDWSVELVGDDPYAEVKSGQLIILGKIRPITVEYPTRPFQLQPLSYTSNHSVDVRYHPDLPEASPHANERPFAWGLLAGFHRTSVNSVYCRMLVIQPMPGLAATFKRVGSMTIKLDLKNEEGAEPWNTAVDWFLAAETQQIYLV